MEFFLEWMNSVCRLKPTIRSGSPAQEEGRNRS
jgi:hypothetical protein